MAELFVESGMSKDVAVSSPALQGIFIPGLDMKDMIDGFGLVTPLGGGSSSRSYLDYGASAEASTYNTLLSDLTTSLIPAIGGGISYNLEGLVGPQGPVGPAGPAGLPGTGITLYSPPNGLFALSSALQQIQILGTDVDRMIYTEGAVFYYDWTEVTPEGRTDIKWESLACDSDMSFLITAGNNGRLYVSSNYGATWVEKYPPGGVAGNKSWTDVACDSDGSNLIACFTTGRLYTSNDYGVTWTERQPDGDANKSWFRVASNSTGSFLVAAIKPGRLYTSNDSGVTWVERQPAGDNSKEWYGIACSSTGQKIIVLDASVGRVWLSTDYGVTWTEKRPTGINSGYIWATVACDSDMSTIVVSKWGTASNNCLYVSVNGGDSWSSVDPTEGAYGIPAWIGIDVSVSGNVIIVSNYYKMYGGKDVGFVWISYNKGLTWTIQYVDGTTPHVWTDLAMSNNGSMWAISAAGLDATNNVAKIFTTQDDYDVVPIWAETPITEFARSLVDDETSAEARTTLGLGAGDSPTFTDLTLSTPSNIYALSHDSFADFVADEHVAHTGVSITAGAGLSGGGDISTTRTLNCSITQYTDALARAAISETVTGLDYNNTTGVLSLSAGYVIPTTTEETNWNTAYGWGNHAGLYDAVGEAAAEIAAHELTYNHGSYDTAYGWGDHSLAGYLTGITGESIGDLADVDLTDIGADKILQYNAVTEKWECEVPGAGADNYTVKVDAAATADYIGAASNDGVLRTTTGLSYTDGGNFVTLGLSHLGLEALADPNADKIFFWDDSETASKWLAPTEGIQISTTNLKLDINGLTADASPDGTADYLTTYDTSTSTHKKVLPTNLLTKAQVVDRGDPAAHDYDLTTFTADGTWRDWDLSGVVPAGATWVILWVSWCTTAANNRIWLRKDGNTNTINTSCLRTQVANVRIDYDVFVPVSANRVIEYNLTSGMSFYGTNVASVKGWII